MVKNKEEKWLQEYTDDCSMKLFGKKEIELEIADRHKLSRYINDLANPIWRDVVVHGIVYDQEVSNTGIVRNKYNKTISKPFPDKDGYLTVSISYPKHTSLRKIHRIVAEAFIPNPENKPEVNHIIPDKTLNWVGNLEWATRRENYDHAAAHGLENHMGRKGIYNNRCVYTENQIRQVCKMLEDTSIRPIEIEKATGVSRIDIYHIRKRDVWNHISKDYNFTDKVDYVFGENNVNNKYTIDQVRTACKLLEDGKLNPKKIGEIVGMSSDAVTDIKKGRTWCWIAAGYDIKDTNFSSGEGSVTGVYTEDQVRKVCKLLENPYIECTEISKITGVSPDMISRIYNGKAWKTVAKDYNMQPRRNAKSEKIIEYHKQGLKYPEIYDLMKTEFEGVDRRAGTLRIGDVIRRYKIQQSKEMSKNNK